MKQRLIILSDLWGQQKADWLPAYLEILTPVFDIQYYDCCTLASIDTTTYTEQALHTQFAQGSITKAVENLLGYERESLSILAFSVGGTIAWKANLKGLPVKNLFAVSATRLRYETKKPDSKIKLYFGKEDSFRPKETWLEKMKVPYRLVQNKGHMIYSDPKEISRVCQDLRKTIET